MTQQWRNGGGEKANLMSDALFAKSANHCVFILLIFISKSLVNGLFRQTVLTEILRIVIVIIFHFVASYTARQLPTLVKA